MYPVVCQDAVALLASASIAVWVSLTEDIGPELVDSCFFFSSRRRHTICLSDWSSDVCSYDLARLLRFVRQLRAFHAERELSRERVDLPALIDRIEAMVVAGDEREHSDTPAGRGERDVEQIGRASCRARGGRRGEGTGESKRWH